MTNSVFGCCCGHIVPVLGNGVFRQVEVDGRDGGDGVHTHTLGVACQLHAVGGVVAADMGNHGQLALGFAHHGLQNGLAFIDVLVDALAGGAAHIHALDALGDQVAGQRLDPLHRNVALCVIAGVKGRDDTLIFFDIFHVSSPSLIIIVSCIKLVRFSVLGNGISALLRCPASASALGRVSRLADRCAKNCSLNIKLVRFSVRVTASAPSCGALHPLRPLGGSRVLQTAAPKIAPCFGRRPRSQF